MAGQDLGLSALPNARDLGGYPAAGGVPVREGLLLRSEALTNATPEDLEALTELRVGLVIDLRGDVEIARFGAGPWAGPRTHLPTTDLTQAVFARMMNAGPDGEVLSEDEVVKVMREMYRQFVADDQSRATFAEAVELITERSSRGIPVLFHCTAGKDRTGWLSAILLTALGVDRETVLADYLLTNERSTAGRAAAPRAKLLETLRSLIGERQPVTPLLEARAAYLQAAFEEVEARYGDMPTFLSAGLGVDVEKLRAVLL